MGWREQLTVVIELLLVVEAGVAAKGEMLSNVLHKTLQEPMSRYFLLSVLTLVSALAVSPPTNAEPVTDLTKIVLGEYHGCGITRTGALRCFGSNSDGQLGTEQPHAKHALTILPAGVTDVAISNNHTCAVVDSTLYCWGNNKYGQLGTGTAETSIKTPTKASAISGAVRSVAVGGATTCVILAPNGSLQCWGLNNLGQVGSGTSDEIVLQPVTVIPSGVTAVAVGVQNTCAVVDGGLQCWGFLLFKEKDFVTLRHPTSIIPAGHEVTAVDVALHACAIVKRSLQCWGRNFHNQVGIPEGSRVAPKVPITIIPSGVTAMALNSENTCAVVNGSLMCWGWNGFGQWGLPVSSGSPTPVPLQVPGVPPARIQTIAIGMRQVCVLSSMTNGTDAALLQCTGRTQDPEDVDDTEPPPPPEQWLAFGTEGIRLSLPPSVLPRVARYGLWQGTIGTQNVMVLLAPTAQCSARYYYKKHLWSIHLTEKDRRQGKVWKESLGSEQEATWTFSDLSPDGRVLNGEWASQDGNRRLPIRLNLQAPTPAIDDDGKPKYDCDAHDKTFDAPRIARARQERKVAQVNNYQQSVALLGDRIRRFALSDYSRHPRLRKSLDDWDSESVSQFYDCASSMAGRFGGNGASTDFSRELDVQFANSKLLILRESYSNYCGGAHPNGGLSNYLIWDMDSDHPVDTWKWIKGSDQHGRITSKKLLHLLAARYSRRNETGEGGCADALQGHEYFHAYPQTAGMVFSPSLPHVIRACEEDIKIPWAHMRHFLTSTGQKALRTYFDIPQDN